MQLVALFLCASLVSLLGTSTHLLKWRLSTTVVLTLNLTVQFLICVQTFVQVSSNDDKSSNSLTSQLWASRDAFARAFHAPHNLWHQQHQHQHQQHQQQRHSWGTLALCVLGGPHYLFLVRGTIASLWSYLLVALFVRRWFLFLFIALLRGYAYANFALLLLFHVAMLAAHAAMRRMQAWLAQSPLSAAAAAATTTTTTMTTARRVQLTLMERETVERALTQFSTLLRMNELLRTHVATLGEHISGNGPAAVPEVPAMGTMSTRQLQLMRRDLGEQMEMLDDEIRARAVAVSTDVQQEQEQEQQEQHHRSNCISSGDVCVICRTREPDMILKPCFHKCCCYPCLFNGRANSGGGDNDDDDEELYRYFDTSSLSVRTCPICRCVISRFAYDGDALPRKFVTETPHSSPAAFHELGRALAQQEMEKYEKLGVMK